MFHPVSGQLYGLEKFWAFLKYAKQKPKDIRPELKEKLKQYKRLEDFRIEVMITQPACLPAVSYWYFDGAIYR